MPKKLPEDLAAKIESEIARHPDGVGINDLHTALADIVSRRTLQRRLASLIEQKRIRAEGDGRALKYHGGTGDVTVALQGVSVTASPGQVAAEAYVPVSADGDDIRAYVRQPIQGRKPVGYDRELLETYRPNETRYLSPEIREHLHNIGRSPAGERPAGTYARDILGRLLIDLSWASSRLEGNTYTRLDTQNLIELGQAAEGKDRREAQMILNHKAAIELLVEQAEDIGFNTFTFFNLHALLSENLLADPGESGRLRSRIVEVSGTVFHPLGIPQQIDAYFHMVLDKAGAIDDPFEQAFFVMVHIPYLQPFVDVNKRVSRLGANIPLIRHNLCPLSFIEVEQADYVDGTLVVYEQNRVECLRDVFVWAYQRSCARYAAVRQSLGDPDPFRLKHRAAIGDAVRAVVQGKMNAATTKRTLPKHAAALPPAERAQFVGVVQKELSALHPGSIMRYRLRPSEFEAWTKLQTR